MQEFRDNALHTIENAKRSWQARGVQNLAGSGEVWDSRLDVDEETQNAYIRVEFNPLLRKQEQERLINEQLPREEECVVQFLSDVLNQSGVENTEIVLSRPDEFGSNQVGQSFGVNFIESGLQSVPLPANGKSRSVRTETAIQGYGKTTTATPVEAKFYAITHSPDSSLQVIPADDKKVTWVDNPVVIIARQFNNEGFNKTSIWITEETYQSIVNPHSF